MDFLTTILAEKRLEIAQLPANQGSPNIPTARPSFYEIVRNNPTKMHVIGEIKRASPSKGAIHPTVDVVTQATTYEAAGVSAISVLTDPLFFKGSIDDLRTVAEVVSVPLLCKDFILDVKQLIRAKAAGASIVLLIVAALTQAELEQLYQQAIELGLEVLVETHDLDELLRAQAIGAHLIGVNNRHLKTFDVTIATSEQLAPPADNRVYISESGFRTAADVARITAHYHAVLVGETLMRASQPGSKVQELQVKR